MANGKNSNAALCNITILIFNCSETKNSFRTIKDKFYIQLKISSTFGQKKKLILTTFLKSVAEVYEINIKQTK